MRRRQRQSDSLANLSVVRGVLGELKDHFPALSNLPDRKLRKLLLAVRHLETYPATATNRGRPSKFDRELLDQIRRHMVRAFETALRTPYRPTTVYLDPVGLVLMPDPKKDSQANEKSFESVIGGWSRWTRNLTVWQSPVLTSHCYADLMSPPYPTGCGGGCGNETEKTILLRIYS
ncbi:MAG TPA: hypothetical protein VJ302_10125 [Blastocatellia bacterium]|nr:hypothetical protein [Blastocatellia bacterium]